MCIMILIISISSSSYSICYGTNSGAPNDGRHLASGRLTGPRDEALPSISAHGAQGVSTLSTICSWMLIVSRPKQLQISLIYKWVAFPIVS
jgi:hypothetical protein